MFLSSIFIILIFNELNTYLLTIINKLLLAFNLQTKQRINLSIVKSNDYQQFYSRYSKGKIKCIDICQKNIVLIILL